MKAAIQCTALFALLSVSAVAQTGKPNLSGAVPQDRSGKPDLSGIWLRTPPPRQPSRGDVFALENLLSRMPPGADIPLQPWAEELFKKRVESFAADRPSGRCLPHGIPDAMVHGGPIKIVQTSGLTILLFEEFNHYRQIFTDGRTRPGDLNPAWFGYSTGKWEADTFVVDTRGFNDQSWLDDTGHPHTEALHTIERFRRRDFGHMDVEVTIDDPKAYTRPWSATIRFNLVPTAELIEDICENERDARHMTGK